MNDHTSEMPQTIVMLPSSVLEKLQATQEKILNKLDNLNSESLKEEYLTAIEFMAKTKMCRATFDEKRANNEIKVIKRGRKLYLTADSVKNYIEGK